MTILPLIFSNTLHMLFVRKNLLKSCNIPVYSELFGTNKTWRGFIILPLFNSIFTSVISLIYPFSVLNYPAVTGYLLGIIYLLAELPNSFIKRNIGIPSGESAMTGRYLFHFLDKTDSAAGVTLVYFLITGISVEEALILFAISIAVHITMSIFLVKLKIKNSF